MSSAKPAKLYVCGKRESAASLGHPCGRAIVSLRNAGFEPEIETVAGYRALPWTRSGKRDEIRELTGQEHVPVLILSDGSAIAGSGRIIKWAKANQT